MTSVCYNGWHMKEDQRLYQERIVADPRILAGKPVVKGTRIAVDLVLEELSHNPDIGELLAAHPDLSRTDVQACLAYAQALVTGEGSPQSLRREGVPMQLYEIPVRPERRLQTYSSPS